MPDLARLSISNYEALGRLIKTWALNIDRVHDNPVDGPAVPGVSPEAAFLPQPQDLQGFCDMLVAAKATGQDSIDFWRTTFNGSFKLVQSTEAELIVRLPMARMLLEMEAKLKSGTDYPLAEFYSSRFFGNASSNVAPTEKASAHNERVGEYTISQCG